ncbi:hypothetical protein J6590_102517, partial [Homalodisca vitripennis]
MPRSSPAAPIIALIVQRMRNHCETSAYAQFSVLQQLPAEETSPYSYCTQIT